jgi:small-conductance mechanosensitive channel
MPAYMEPRRRPEDVNVGRPRPTSRVRVIEEQEQLNWGDQRLDRRLESRHFVELREHRREAAVGMSEKTRDAAIAAGAIEAKRKYLYELKQQLLRARQESEVLARGDVALMAEFSALDEDLYQTGRLYGMDLDD